MWAAQIGHDDHAKAGETLKVFDTFKEAETWVLEQRRSAAVWSLIDGKPKVWE